MEGIWKRKDRIENQRCDRSLRVPTFKERLLGGFLSVWVRAAPGGAGCGGGAGAVWSQEAAVRGAIGKLGCAVWRPEERAAPRVRWVPGALYGCGPGAVQTRYRPGAVRARCRTQNVGVRSVHCAVWGSGVRVPGKARCGAHGYGCGAYPEPALAGARKKQGGAAWYWPRAVRRVVQVSPPASSAHPL